MGQTVGCGGLKLLAQGIIVLWLLGSPRGPTMSQFVVAGGGPAEPAPAWSGIRAPAFCAYEGMKAVWCLETLGSLEHDSLCALGGGM